jgi:hypothetical protein
MTRINTLDRRAPTLSSSAVRVVGGQFVETQGSAAGTYVHDVFIPAYALLIDSYVHADTLFTAGTSAKLDVGFWSVVSGVIDAVIDVDDVYDDIDVKATDLLITHSISLAWAAGKHGNLGGVVATQDDLVDRVDDVDRFLRYTLTTVGTVGTAGEVYVYTTYALPEMDVATFTAT